MIKSRSQRFLELAMTHLADAAASTELAQKLIDKAKDAEAIEAKEEEKPQWLMDRESGAYH